uniref:Stabilizer of axonemal microtubules 1 n=1 Tax=Nothoprocta perdicaria TaxID=30464 RepID=A0A8C7EF55_NOTPE
VTRKCLCSLCSEDFCLLSTKPVPEKPCFLTEYMEKYPLYPSSHPRHSFKPREEYTKPQTPMEGISTVKRDYVAHEVFPPKFKPPEKIVKSDESMDLISTYRQDYNPYPICQVPPCLPRENKHTCSDKMDTWTTYKGDYVQWNEPKRGMIRPDDAYRPSEEKFDHRTHVQDDYLYRGPVATKSFKPVNQAQGNKDPFETATNYKVDYVLHPLEKPYVHKREKYKASEVPFDGLTTHKISYKGLAGQPAKLAKPCQSRPQHDLPFSSTTEFQEKYRTWPLPPLFSKKPAVYVPPEEKMDLHTTTQLHYKHPHGQPARICRSLVQFKKNTEPFTSSSTMKEDYKPWQCKRTKPIVPAPQMTCPSEPSDYSTTFQTHFRPHPLCITQSCKPRWPGPRPWTPLEAKTTYATSYTPKRTSRCLASYKEPPGYVFKGSDEIGHKLFLPVFKGECSVSGH